MDCTVHDHGFEFFSKLFITCDVNATGRKSFGLAGRGFWGICMTVDVFQKVGIFCKLRETWKMKWKIPGN